MNDSLFIHNIAVNILSNDAAYNNLHYLTKNIGGRLAGSPKMVLAEQWGAKAMKEMWRTNGNPAGMYCAALGAWW